MRTIPLSHLETSKQRFVAPPYHVLDIGEPILYTDCLDVFRRWRSAARVAGCRATLLIWDWQDRQSSRITDYWLPFRALVDQCDSVIVVSKNKAFARTLKQARPPVTSAEFDAFVSGAVGTRVS